jgi:hypothetical protein
MKQKSYDIFISYRRDGSFETAGLIAEKLRNAGYSVFFDVESLRSGKFNEQLFRVIENCRDFILILPKNGLDRCVNETDWVRQEIVHAMKHKKNIIPVMLREFVFPETLSVELEELRNYQGIIAGDHNYFDASVEKLKSYLKSQKGFTWRKYGNSLIVAIFLLAIVSGVFLWNYYKEKQHFTRLCVEQANLMSIGIAAISHNLDIAKSVHDEWDKFRKKLSVTVPENVPAIKQEFIAWIENQKKSIMPPGSECKISDETAGILNKHGIKVSDIKAFYSMALPRDVEDAAHYLNQLQTYSAEDYIPEVYDKFAHYNYQFLDASGKSTYYYFLGLLSTMPEEVYKDFNKMQQYLYNFSEIPTKLSYDEYEAKGDAMLKKAEDIVMNMGTIVNTEDKDVETLQHQLNEINKKISEDKNVEKLQHQLSEINKKVSEKKKDVDTEKEIAARTQNIQNMTADVIEKQKHLQETETKIEESLRNIIEKCKLAPDDDQYLMWGKILRIATNMARTSVRRMESQRLNEQEKKAAQAKGYDVSNLFSIKYSLTMDEMLQELTNRLDQYMQYFPDTKSYVPAVKQFYIDVKNGKQTLCGMAVIGTKDDITHPVFKIGDIVLSRKGKTVNSTEAYKSIAETEGDDTVTFLRLSDGKLQTYTKPFPKTDILVGFLVLKEE